MKEALQKQRIEAFALTCKLLPIQQKIEKQEDKNIYKLSLVGSYFWQTDDKGTISKLTYNKKDDEELNYIYFSKDDKENQYRELSTNAIFSFNVDESSSKLLSPSGILIDLNNIEIANFEDVKYAYFQLIQKNLSASYLSTLKDLFVKTEACEKLYKEKATKKLKKRY